MAGHGTPSLADRLHVENIPNGTSERQHISTKLGPVPLLATPATSIRVNPALHFQGQVDMSVLAVSNMALAGIRDAHEGQTVSLVRLHATD